MSKLHITYASISLFFLFTLIILTCTNDSAEIGVHDKQLRVSDNGHFLMQGKDPFFWMGETAWLLLTLSPEDINLYMQNRVENQFNIIQMMATRRRFNEPVFTTNYYGENPFIDMDPAKINENYFCYLDTIVKEAEKHNLYLAIAPTWGTVLDQIFSIYEPQIAYDFGLFLGERYKSYNNVIWIVSGEYHKIAYDSAIRVPDNKPDELELNLIENLAKGLEKGHGGANLMTIHPDGYKSSSDHFHNAEWLDFNMAQTWSIGKKNEFLIRDDFRLEPPKPTILSEPGYEFGGAGHKAFDLRYEGYHSVINGGFGYTYGCEGIWNYKDNWKDLLNSEGTMQMKFLRRLIESRPQLSRIPFPELIVGDSGNWVKRSKAISAKSENGEYAFIYIPDDTSRYKINVGLISGDHANARWYNPRDGKCYDLHNNETSDPFSIFECNENQIIEVDPPGNHGKGYDWILILDDESLEYKSPC